MPTGWPACSTPSGRPSSSESGGGCPADAHATVMSGFTTTHSIVMNCADTPCRCTSSALTVRRIAAGSSRKGAHDVTIARTNVERRAAASPFPTTSPTTRIEFPLRPSATW